MASSASSRPPSSSARCSIILDSFFQIPGIPPDPDELPFLRDIWTALDSSQIVAVFRETLIPFFFLLTGLFIPDRVEAMYPSA